MTQTLKYIIILSILVLWAGIFIMPTRPMPDNAMVLIDDQNQAYLSPVCARKEDRQFRTGRALEARRLRYEPDKKCRDQGGFRQDGRSYTGQLLETVGLLKPLPSRWNADGTWNW